MKIQLQPFRTPNFALAVMPPSKRGDGFVQAPSYPLRDLDASELSDMCDAFRAEVFEKARKADPMKPQPNESQK
jgi:hypothetical protein